MNDNIHKKKKVLLSIAGFDPTSGAGILLDIKVFDYLGFPGMGIITAVTSQNTKEVKKVHCLSPEWLWDQFQTLNNDVQIHGIKFGMTGCQENLKPIEKILNETPEIPKILDPVFKSSSGTWLLEKEAISEYLNTFKGKATLITPNLEEAYLATGIKISDPSHMQAAAKKLFGRMQCACLIKGGHFTHTALDLFYDGKHFVSIKNKKINKNVHGTGCFLSSSILGFIVRGSPLLEACRKAVKLTHQAIEKAESIGQGQDLISVVYYGSGPNKDTHL